MADLDDSSDFIEPASDDASGHASSAVAHAHAYAHVPGGDDDDDDDDAGVATSDYDPSLSEPLVGSVTSSVAEHVYRNGRRYHSYKRGRYPLPNDDEEGARENVRNVLFAEMLGGKLHLAPIGDKPQKIMDVGTGFGDWAIEMADKYPSATVIGLDLSPIQPVWIPPNVSFVVDDVEENAWIHGSGFDLVHFRIVAAALKSLERVAATVFEHLKPGGWIEFQELNPRPACQDGTMPDDYVVSRFYELLGRVHQLKYGWDLYAAETLPALLARTGFVNLQRKVYHIPLGFWPKDRTRMQHAFLFREILTELLTALQATPFNGNDPDVGLTQHEIATLFDDVRVALCDKRVHAYITLHIVWAQKPYEAAPR